MGFGSRACECTASFLIRLLMSPYICYLCCENGELIPILKETFHLAVKPIEDRHNLQTPISFSTPLRRALTLPLPEKRFVARRTGRTETQSQSGFFKLPYELREMVYVQILQFPALHLKGYGRRTRGARCACLTGINDFAQPMIKLPAPADCVTLTKLDSVLALLCSCRRIYSEAIDILYCKNKFLMHWHALASLPRKLVPGRLASIQCLRVNASTYDVKGWKRACTVLKRMKGLRMLYVSVGCPSNYQDLQDGTPYIKPLMTLRVPDFVVQLPVTLVIFGVECQQLFERGGEEIGGLVNLPFRILWAEKP
ncbi:hypothetical protein BJY04DRAFT_224724 [Aspergillus karnatakaensis]|uniref:uncharacterized protein n=1 Tax=Aspergillus karnatakaensis TaxID=1810916 RepID=UPI003CCCAAB8